MDNTNNNPQLKPENVPHNIKTSEEKDKKEDIEKNEKEIDIPQSDEIELKDHYSIDDISYSQFEKGSDDENSVLSQKKLKINEIALAIKENDLEKLKNLLSGKKSLINKKTLDGFSYIQYAALNGAINCFNYLLSLKVKTDEDIEGFHLIHLSLIKCIFKKYLNKCLGMFAFIFQNLPEQKSKVDRLGRSYLHIIFEYNIVEALDYINVPIEDLFLEDNNGEYAINYIYLYNAENCFWKVAKDPKFLHDIYITIRQKYKDNKSIYFSKEEKFLENLFLYQNYKVIATIVMNCSSFNKEIIYDLYCIYNTYSELYNEKTLDIEKNDIKDMLTNIKYIYDNLSSKEIVDQDFKFQFPKNKLSQKTAIVYNKNCINHIKLPDNNVIKHMNKRKKLYENSDRLSCLINEDDGIIMNDKIFNAETRDNNSMFPQTFIFEETDRKSCLNDILKCHNIKYIKALKYKSDHIKKIKKNLDKNKAPKFWENLDIDLIEHNYFLNDDNNNETTEDSINLYDYEKIDIDTFINHYSFENIFNTTGCIFRAIDLVMDEHAINAFALVRPPGHHSGYYGPVENQYETSNGFCIVNNIAIGAAYTKYKYKEHIQKIAIVDIDVHHGNGTEEIIELLNYKDFSKPFKYEKIGGVNISEKQNINWLDFDDAKNVLFISTHIYDKNNPDKFYPYSGSEEKNTKKDSDIYPGGIYNIPFEYKENYPYEYKNILRSKIIPRLYKFKPDIIFVSAGFDGHKLEKINQNHMLLQENDYGYIAQQLQLVANKFCKGRMIAVLEGGYNINTGVISPFAQSVMSFIRYMNIAINIYHCTDVKLTSHKRKQVFNEDMEIYNMNVKEKEEEEVKPRRSERIKQMEEEKEKDIEDKKEEINENNIIENGGNYNINEQGNIHNGNNSNINQEINEINDNGKNINTEININTKNNIDNAKKDIQNIIGINNLEKNKNESNNNMMNIENNINNNDNDNKDPKIHIDNKEIKNDVNKDNLDVKDETNNNIDNKNNKDKNGK